MSSGFILFITAITPPPVFKTSEIEKTEYGADVLNADRPAQGAPFIDPDHVKKLRPMVHDGWWV